MGAPGAAGRFGDFGGRFVPESLMPACLELEKWFDDAWADPEFRTELDDLLRHYGGRPTPVTECARPPRSQGPPACPNASGCGCSSSGRTWPTRARTSSTTWWARRC